jgi:hypothetical protein
MKYLKVFVCKFETIVTWQIIKLKNFTLTKLNPFTASDDMTNLLNLSLF